MTREVDGIPEGVQNAAVDMSTYGLFQFRVQSFGICTFKVADMADTDQFKHFSEFRSDPRDGLEGF